MARSALPSCVEWSANFITPKSINQYCHRDETLNSKPVGSEGRRGRWATPTMTLTLTLAHERIGKEALRL